MLEAERHYFVRWHDVLNHPANHALELRWVALLIFVFAALGCGDDGNQDRHQNTDYTC